MDKEKILFACSLVCMDNYLGFILSSGDETIICTEFTEFTSRPGYCIDHLSRFQNTLFPTDSKTHNEYECLSLENCLAGSNLYDQLVV